MVVGEMLGKKFSNLLFFCQYLQVRMRLLDVNVRADFYEEDVIR